MNNTKFNLIFKKVNSLVLSALKFVNNTPSFHNSFNKYLWSILYVILSIILGYRNYNYYIVYFILYNNIIYSIITTRNIIEIKN